MKPPAPREWHFARRSVAGGARAALRRGPPVGARCARGARARAGRSGARRPLGPSGSSGDREGEPPDPAAGARSAAAGLLAILQSLSQGRYTAKQLARVIPEEVVMDSSLFDKAIEKGRLDEARHVCTAFVKRHHPGWPPGCCQPSRSAPTSPRLQPLDAPSARGVVESSCGWSGRSGTLPRTSHASGPAARLGAARGTSARAR